MVKSQKWEYLLCLYIHTNIIIKSAKTSGEQRGMVPVFSVLEHPQAVFGKEYS